MPFTIAWHETLPVLIVTYRGELSLSEYRQLVKKRAELLRGGPEQTVIVADMREFDGFPDAEVVHDSENVTRLDHVRATLFVVEAAPHKRLLRSVVHDPDQRLSTYWFAELDQALDAAHVILS